jgi:nitrogen fixation/metabolism regulation signal transduction histidine kinase
MRILGRTERRVVAAILVTALIPLVGALLTSRTIIRRVSAAAFQPEFGAALDQSLGVYADLVKATKAAMRFEAEALAASAELRRAASSSDRPALEAALGEASQRYPSVASLRVETSAGELVAERGRPVDAANERALTVRHELAEPSADGRDPPILVATLVAPAARFAEVEAMQELVQAYHQLERDQREAYLDSTYQSAFAALLVFTIAVAVALGVVVARPVTNRIARLAAATRPVAAGDLSVRVADDGSDEVADLARAFNRMLHDLEQSRARVEFLRRMGEWQKVARRLAHEIKNPLTPIQLAVEECHRRYTGDDPAYRRIVQTMHEVVTEEIASLRRLVSEFSSFARLPQAELVPCDLSAYLAEQRDRFLLPASAGRASDEERELLSHVDLAFELPEAPAPAAIDREMMHRVLANVLANAAQALRDARAPKSAHTGATRAPATWGRVRVALAVEPDGYAIAVDDDGPGVDPEIASVLFDPYVTTKNDGTGLGLSIVKKIVMDHGGTIEAQRSPLGGARFLLRLPRARGAPMATGGPLR